MSVAAVVADDLTGAADAAAGFLRAGFTAIVTWSAGDVDHGMARQADVLAVDMGTRVLEAAAARARTTAVVARLSDTGVTTLCVKIDSMLRGHIGAELSGALAVWHPRRGAMAIVAPAFPVLGRTTIDGRQRVNGVVLDRPAIPTLLEQSGISTRSVDLSAVRSGRVAASFEHYLEEGVGAVVCDAELEADLVAIAEAGAHLGNRVIWVGSAGLAHALARTAVPRVRRQPIPVTGGEAGAILIVVGSTAPIAAAQAAHLASGGAKRVEVAVEALDGSDRRKGTLVTEDVERLLRQGLDVVVTIADHPVHSDPARLSASLAALLEPAAPLVRGLIVTGGETATHILAACGARALYLLDEIEPGVPLSVAIGARSLPVVTKAGSFGTASTLAAARSRLHHITVIADAVRSKQTGGAR